MQYHGIESTSSMTFLHYNHGTVGRMKCISSLESVEASTDSKLESEDASTDPKTRVGGGLHRPKRQSRWMHPTTLYFDRPVWWGPDRFISKKNLSNFLNESPHLQSHICNWSGPQQPVWWGPGRCGPNLNLSSPPLNQSKKMVGPSSTCLKKWPIYLYDVLGDEMKLAKACPE